MARPLTVRIEDAGLANRTPRVLARERRMMPRMVLALEGDAKAPPDGALQRLTMPLISTVLRRGAGGDWTRLPAAAFLAGRVAPAKERDADELTGLLRAFVEQLDAGALMALAPSYVESAMSIGLLGDTDRGQALLSDIAVDGGRGTTHDWQAAYYLAQYGDARGWPAMLAALTGTDAHTRLMATRHLFPFATFDGRVVDGAPIDVRGRLLERLDDDSAYVAVEVPGLLAESGVPGVVDELRQASETSKHPEVRGSAKDVLAILEREAGAP